MELEALSQKSHVIVPTTLKSEMEMMKLFNVDPAIGVAMRWATEAHRNLPKYDYNFVYFLFRLICQQNLQMFYER